MRLILETTGQQIKYGDVLRSRDGDLYLFQFGIEPKHEGSTGRVVVQPPATNGGFKRDTREFYPSVFGAKWAGGLP